MRTGPEALIPETCSICGEDDILHNRPHCVVLKNRLKDIKQRYAHQSELLDAIVCGYRNGDPTKAINQAAYHIGRSVSPTEFKWLDEEVKRLRDAKPKVGMIDRITNWFKGE